MSVNGELEEIQALGPTQRNSHPRLRAVARWALSIAPSGFQGPDARTVADSLSMNKSSWFAVDLARESRKALVGGQSG